MKILFTRFPLDSALGGAEIQTLSLMEGLIERGHTVAFAGSCPTLLSECRKRNIPTVELHIGQPPVTKWGALSFAWRKQQMKKSLTLMLSEFHDLDVICMLSLSEKILLTDIAAEQGMKTIWIEHDRVGNWLTKNPWLKPLLEQSKKATTVAVSALSRKIYIDLGWSEERTIAIPNGIDFQRLQVTQLSAKSYPLKAIRFGCVSRLSPEKGVDLLVEAMADVPEEMHLEIVGKGPEEGRLKALVQSLQLESRVTFSEPHPNIADVLARFDTLILPSRDNDPFGLVVAEAMMMGIPCIVTDACGIAGYLKNGSDAIIAKANSISALTDAISTIRDTAMRTQLSENGQKTAQEKFSVERMVDMYEKIFTI